jgi:hypothetical protein
VLVLLLHVCLQAAEAAEAVKVQQAKAAALAQKQVQMQQLEHMKQRILEERWVNTAHPGGIAACSVTSIQQPLAQ